MSLLHRIPSRLVFLSIALSCGAMLGFALYLQYYRYLNPCPLCMFQRAMVLMVGVLALLAAVHGRAGRRWAGLCGLAALGGLAIAIRHTVLQYWPPANLGLCGAGLFEMLERDPFGAVIVTVLKGSGECALIDWTLLGLSLPGWTALGFVGLAVLAALAGWRYQPRPAL